MCRVVSSNWLPLSFNPRFILNSVQSYHLATLRFEVNPNLIIVRCQFDEIPDVAHGDSDSPFPPTSIHDSELPQLGI
jgi:hypothetical protein